MSSMSVGESGGQYYSGGLHVGLLSPVAGWTTAEGRRPQKHLALGDAVVGGLCHGSLGVASAQV